MSDIVYVWLSFLFRYYLADEPGGQRIDPKLLEKAYDFVKVQTAT